MNPHFIFRSAAVVATLGVCAAASPSGESGSHVRSASVIEPGHAASCPQGSLMDEGTCVILAGESQGDTPGQIARNAHRTKAGRWDPYDQIPLLPDRPADYSAYRYPVVSPKAGSTDSMSGYDLDKPDDEQRRGTFLRAVGHGAIDLMRARGTAVTLVPLRAQVGAARGVYAGHLIGQSVVTEHVRMEGDEPIIYLLFYGHLNDTASGLEAHTELAEGSLLGHVGDSDSPGVVHLHLEVRRWRGTKSPAATLQHDGPGALLARDHSVVCDPRNVLPLKTE